MTRQIKLGCQDRAAFALNPDMQVWRPSRVGSRYQCIEHELSILIGELMSSKTVSLIIVLTFIIALPEIDEHPGYRSTVCINHLASQPHLTCCHIGFNEAATLR